MITVARVAKFFSSICVILVLILIMDHLIRQNLSWRDWMGIAIAVAGVISIGACINLIPEDDGRPF